VKVTAVDNSLFEGIDSLAGQKLDAAKLDGQAVLVVNVASRCGLTPQYEGLEALQKRFGDRGFTVLGVPCNQFAGQEPGSAEEIQEFCSTTYGTTFPMTEKLDVNGMHRHPLFDWLTTTADADGRAGEVEWNFEKFLVTPSGEVRGRFRPPVQPDSDELVGAIEALLDGPAETKTIKAGEVKVGDRLQTPSGDELLVTRIDDSLMGSGDYLAFVEDSPARWLKMPMPRDAEVQVAVAP
jgi:glutathione peroxidase